MLSNLRINLLDIGDVICILILYSVDSLPNTALIYRAILNSISDLMEHVGLLSSGNTCETPQWGVVAKWTYSASHVYLACASLCSRHGVDGDARSVNRSHNWCHAAANSNRLPQQVDKNTQVMS